MRRGGAKSFVDDLGWSRGVVLSRAATLLRSIETQPYDSRICSHTDEHTPLSERREKIKINVFFFANCGHTGGLVPHICPFSVRQNRYPLGVYYSRVQCPAGLVVIDPAARHPRHAVLAPHPARDHTILAITQKQHTNATATTLAKTHTHWGSKCLFATPAMCWCLCVSLPRHACLKVMVPR